LWIPTSSLVVGSVNFRLPCATLGFTEGDIFNSDVVLTEIVVVFSILFHRASVNSTSPFKVSSGYIVSFSSLTPIFFISPGSTFSSIFLGSNHGTVTVISSLPALYHGTRYTVLSHFSIISEFACLSFIFLLPLSSFVSSATIIFANLFLESKATFDVILIICHPFLSVSFIGMAFFVFILQSSL
jgi:hypothetical protein